MGVQGSSSEIDSAELSLLYVEHAERLQRYVYGKIGCAETAADLIQDVFVKLCCQKKRAHISDLKSYLYQMARNAVVDHYRSTQLERQRQDYRDVMDFVDLSDDRPACDEEASVRQQLDSLMLAVSALPALGRNIFTLRHMNGFKNREVADHLGICQSTVEKNLAQAKGYCREMVTNSHTSRVAA